MNCHPLIRFGHNTKPPPVWLSRSVGLADQSFTCPRRRARLLPVMATSPSTPAVFRPALRSRPPPARLLACCSSPQHEILQPPGLGQVTCLGRPEVDWPVDGIPAENWVLRSAHFRGRSHLRRHKVRSWRRVAPPGPSAVGSPSPAGARSPRVNDPQERPQRPSGPDPAEPAGLAQLPQVHDIDAVHLGDHPGGQEQHFRVAEAFVSRATAALASRPLR
jgi:hypothetical protein